ncbi:DapA Dihydrodipicolinate synthase/N-acetylneuraminate lyase [Candidatus Nanopelagicaceae bacterium]
MSIKGVCPVLSVPFTKSGEVDYESFRALCQWIIGIGTQSTLFFGVASENIKLSDPERYQLLDILLTEREGSNLKVITTVADHSSELAVNRAKDYEAMGVDYINILPPTFFSPSAAQIDFHLESILKSVKLPVVIQHLPQAGGMADVTGLIHLANKYENLKIIKCEANPPTESIKTVTSLTDGRVRTLIGWGGIFWKEGVAAGADGLQPGCGLTDLYLWAERALLEGNQQEFESRLNRFIPRVAKWISNLELLIAAEKDVLYRRGIIESNYCRTPTVSLDAQTALEIEEMLALIEEVQANV